ncbi:hypothetical protein BJ138DRAFT_343329 [Hygrophoropsis aurantiaca]|uniref:Uncharacterized protein n=1 Tax=Hygrophoropsis aurantiaca TaxID=72124 RepID=A0ACB8A583_9AGAM|nr:hypothetical protein BJ138DRAFT_343329 [Hygrophoropsis aurantiaca]
MIICALRAFLPEFCLADLCQVFEGQECSLVVIKNCNYPTTCKPLDWSSYIQLQCVSDVRAMISFLHPDLVKTILISTPQGLRV